MTSELDAPPSAHATHPLLQRLSRGEAVAALGVRMARSPEVARLAHAAGNHALWIDLEHSTMPLEVAAQICATANDIGVSPLVRIPERAYEMIGRLLDGGAMGIIAPRVETAEDAAALVQACRFPPQGHRSAIGSLAFLAYRRLPAAALFDAANRATLVEVLIESPQGLVAIEAIASVAGIDLVGIGANDLAAELGVPGELGHPRLLAAYEQALQACRRAGKPLAIGGIAEAGLNADLIRRGAAPWMMTGVDTDLLLGAAQARVQAALAAVPARENH